MNNQSFITTSWGNYLDVTLTNIKTYYSANNLIATNLTIENASYNNLSPDLYATLSQYNHVVIITVSLSDGNIITGHINAMINLNINILSSTY